MIEAVEAVRRRLLKSTAALANAKIPYAVVDGNAVAAWVARVDRAAVRNTQDVDILIRRQDFDAVRQALEGVGFVYRQILGVDCFLDHPDAHPRDAVHIVYAREKVKPNEANLISPQRPSAFARHDRNRPNRRNVDRQIST